MFILASDQSEIGIHAEASADFVRLAEGYNRPTNTKEKKDFLASVTGRLGWSGWDPRVLFYVKGGGAWAHDNYQFSYYFGKQSRSGWTVGTGIEWAFAPNWSAFVEWDHYDFGTKQVRVFSATEFDDLDVKQRIETVKVGVNYRFSWFLGKGKAPIAARY